MSKKIMCSFLAATLLIMAIPAFAATNTYSASYSAGEVNHYFVTSKSITKSDTELWARIQDVVSYSKYCNKSSGAVVDETGYHTTYLADKNGKKLSGAQTMGGAGTITFSSASDISAANSAGTVKLRIYNPKYNSSDNVYLKTAGKIKGAAKVIEEASSVSPDLDAE